MTKRAVIITSGVVIFLFTISYIYGLMNTRTGDLDFSLPEDAIVLAVNIISPDNESFLLEMDDEGQWWIDASSRANEYAIKDMVRILRHCEVRQPVAVIDREEVNENLDKNGVLVDIFIEDNLFNFFDMFSFIKIKRRFDTYLVGENLENIVGTYMRKSNSDKPSIVYLPGFSRGIARAFTPEKHVWFDPVIVDLKPGQIRKIKVENNENKGESYILKLEDNMEFEFYDLHNRSISGKLNIDTTKVSRFLSSFNDLYYERLIDDDGYDRSEQLIFPGYAYSYEITDKSNNKISFKVYRRYFEPAVDEHSGKSPVYDPDRFYLVLDNERRAVAQYHIFSRILRGLSFFEAG